MTQDILFDVSRLLSRTERSAPTGVDRVCLAYAEWLLSLPDVRMIPVRSRKDRLVTVEEPWFRDCVAQMRARWSGDFFERSLTEEEARLLKALRSGETSDRSVISPPPEVEKRKPNRPARVWKQFLRSRRSQGVPGGQFYFNVGHTSLNTPDILDDLSTRGVERVVLIHDLIPITHPEFCRPGDGAKHRGRVSNALRHASHIIVNSHYTASELTAFAAREALTPPPIHVAHLGLEPIFQAAPTTRDPHPYFVHVGTIEARKNLAFLLTLWRRLHERLGDRAPRLVLIGRYGWENEAVLDHLQRSPNLQGLVHQAANLPDATLAELMRGARAVLAPSSVEGFDLPAVEASALGVPLIASDIPVHRELVAHAELIDPLDGLGWLAALERATLAAPPPAPAFQAPGWSQHFGHVAERIGLATAESPPPMAPRRKGR
jgi:glycosyltransferase involved in cell wall biosynthesis